MCHYNVFAGLLSTHGTHAQVGGCPKHVEKTSKMAKNILPLGHHLRRPARAPQPRWRPKPIQLRVWSGVQEQSVLKWKPRSQMELDFDVLYMDGKLISRRFQWHKFLVKIHPESMRIIRVFDVHFLSRRCDAVYRSLGLVSCWSALGSCSRCLVRP